VVFYEGGPRLVVFDELFVLFFEIFYVFVDFGNVRGSVSSVVG